MRKVNALIRISLDSGRPQDEYFFRTLCNNEKDNLVCYENKVRNLRILASDQSIHLAVQSVVHMKNRISIFQIPDLLKEFGISKWYLQRFIPSHEMANNSRLNISYNQYDSITSKLRAVCQKKNIQCITKKDKRHNSVYLLIGNGELYTQSEKPGEKIYVGNLRNNDRYFDYVSAPDHFERYYSDPKLLTQ